MYIRAQGWKKFSLTPMFSENPSWTGRRDRQEGVAFSLNFTARSDDGEATFRVPGARSSPVEDDRRN